jgi:hypothetical protein
MEERMDRVERAIEALTSVQADAEMRRQTAEKEMHQLRRVLLSAIRLGRRDRSKMNELINALTASQLRLEEKFERFLDQH